MIKRFAILTICILLLPGCAKWRGAMGMDANLRQCMFQAVDQLLRNSRTPLPDNASVLVASLVNIDALNQSSTFGRTMAEYITSRLVWLGFTATEIKLRKSLYVEQEGGEFLLSRDVKDLGTMYNAQAVVVGSYSLGEYVVYITLRLVETTDNTILASAEIEVPLGVEARRLLRNDRLF